MPILRKPCLGTVSVSPAMGDGDGFQAFVLWRLSLAVCCASSESQKSSVQNSASVTERRDCGLFSTDVLATLTLFLLVLFNPGASRLCAPTWHPSPHFQGQRISVLCVSNPTSHQSPVAPCGLLELPI